MKKKKKIFSIETLNFTWAYVSKWITKIKWNSKYKVIQRKKYYLLIQSQFIFFRVSVTHGTEIMSTK